MTTDEIRNKVPMREIAARYGIAVNRAGFCRCIFHTEKTPSMKLYEDSFYCFSCQKSGDVFDFVQRMDDCDFKTAFQSLGGTYEKQSSFSTRAAIYKAKKAREQAQKARERLNRKKAVNNTLITFYRRRMANYEPLSAIWCDSYNALQYQLYIHGELNEIPY